MPEQKKTQRQLITERLTATPWLAVHEFNIVGHSENALATEVSVMAKKGLATGRYRVGKRFKEWSLVVATEPVCPI